MALLLRLLLHDLGAPPAAAKRASSMHSVAAVTASIRGRIRDAIVTSLLLAARAGAGLTQQRCGEDC